MSQPRHKKTHSQSNGRLVTYREMRELQRQAESSHVGPGSTEYIKPFGSNMPRVGFGRPYEFKASKNPGPGSYNVDTGLTLTKSRSSTALMKETDRRELSGTKRDQPSVGPGTYNPYNQFGHNDKKFTIGRPYEFKPDKNPPPGLYDLEKAWNQITPRTAAPVVRKRVGHDKKIEVTPDAGQYEPSKPFGYTERKMHMGSKYKWKPDSNPHPAYYNPVDTQTKTRAPITKIIGSPKRRNQFLDSPTNGNPSALSYNGIKPFGSENKNRMTLGGPYKWKPSEVPPPGFYDADSNRLKPRAPATVMRKEPMVYYEPPRYKN